jgi:hypothetical protein
MSSGIFISVGTAEGQPAIQPGPNGEVVLVVTFKVIFNVHKVFGAQRTYVQYEIWRSEDALKSHFGRPYTKALLAMFDRDLAVPLARSVNFVVDLDPQPRAAPATTDPASVADCL